jgi:hypothetical protein
MLASISSSGDLRYHLQTTPVNGNDFSAYLESLPYPPGTVLLMDNARIHATSAVQQVMARKQYEPLYIPPYFPDANPIENMFGVLKYHVRDAWGQHVLVHGRCSAPSNAILCALRDVVEDALNACFMTLDAPALFRRAVRIVSGFTAQGCIKEAPFKTQASEGPAMGHGN